MKLYLRVWMLPFDIMYKSKILLWDIRKSSNLLLSLHKNGNPIFFISSTITVPKLPLSYNSIRSVFSEEDRLTQTKLSIESAIQSFPDSEIFLIDNSKVSLAKLSELELGPNVRIVRMESLICKYLSKSPFKGLGEAFLTLAVLNFCKNDDSTFFKLSGRYTLTANAERKFPIDDILFRNNDDWAVTIFYGIGKKKIKSDWQCYLYQNLPLLAKGVALESVLSNFSKVHGFQGSPILHVEGFLSPTGDFISY